MSTIEVANEEDLTPPPEVVVDAKPNGKKEARKESKAKEDGEDDAPARGVDTIETRKLKIAEDATIREIVEALGDEGSFSIKIFRQDPEYTRDASGKNVLTRGYLETVDRKIEEAWIQQKYGGGTYRLTFRKKGGGYVTHRTITIAGEPDLSSLPKASQAVAAGAAPRESEPTPIVTKALEMMNRQLDKAEERAERSAGGGASDAVLDILRDQLRSKDAEISAIRQEMREALAAFRAPPPQTVGDRAQDRMLDKLIDQDTVRLTAQANKYESEIRILRENAIENERRLQDRAERDRQEQRIAHEREIAMMRQSHQNEITTLKTSQEVSLAAARSSYETQTKVAEAENRRLERDIGDLRDEVKELRAKKDKTIPEQVKELNALKELMGVDEANESSTAEKIVEAVTNPEALAAVGQFFQNRNGAAQAAQQQVAAAPAPAKRHVVSDAEGNKFILDGNKLRPAKKIPPPGTSPEVAALPPMDPEEVKRVVSYLESACQAGTDPATVVQSFGSYVPEPIKVAIRDLGGVDQFLSKVAKLPSSSPLLANQAGRNWCKKLSKALGGE